MKHKLLFLFFFFFLSVLFVGPRISSPVTAVTPPVVKGDTMMTTPSVATQEGKMKKKSEYVLPYPGILQNHPLYFLKNLRDRIIEMLIADPVRKGEFYLLQSDKWIASVSILIEKNQIDVAQKVLNQAADRMQAGIGQLSSQKANSRQVPVGVVDKFNQAIEKHLEIVDDLSVDKKVDTTMARATYIKVQEDVLKLRS